MKHLQILVAFLLILSFSAPAQKVKRDANGNFKAIVKEKSDTTALIPTGKTYTDETGQVYPVYIKLYVFKVSKSGKNYAYYLKETN